MIASHLYGRVHYTQNLTRVRNQVFQHGGLGEPQRATEGCALFQHVAVVSIRTMLPRRLAQPGNHSETLRPAAQSRASMNQGATTSSGTVAHESLRPHSPPISESVSNRFNTVQAVVAARWQKLRRGTPRPKRSWLRRPCEAAIAVDPGEEALNDPAAGMDGKSDLTLTFAHDLDADGACCGHTWPPIASVRKSELDKGPPLTRRLQQWPGRKGARIAHSVSVRSFPWRSPARLCCCRCRVADVHIAVSSGLGNPDESRFEPAAQPLRHHAGDVLRQTLRASGPP